MDLVWSLGAIALFLIIWLVVKLLHTEHRLDNAELKVDWLRDKIDYLEENQRTKCDEKTTFGQMQRSAL